MPHNTREAGGAPAPPESGYRLVAVVRLLLELDELRAQRDAEKARQATNTQAEDTHNAH